jgi:hypothetical protein
MGSIIYYYRPQKPNSIPQTDVILELAENRLTANMTCSVFKCSHFGQYPQMEYILNMYKRIAKIQF